jgi:hypothetical protein
MNDDLETLRHERVTNIPTTSTPTPSNIYQITI